MKKNTTRTNNSSPQFGFSEDADGFTRITNPRRFAIAKGVGIVILLTAGGIFYKKVIKE